MRLNVCASSTWLARIARDKYRTLEVVRALIVDLNRRKEGLAYRMLGRREISSRMRKLIVFRMQFSVFRGKDGADLMQR